MIIKKYNGITVELSDKILEPPKVYKNKPRKSKKFDCLSLYYDGVYYFISSIKETDEKVNEPFEIQACFYIGKWYQDTFYITKEFKEMLLRALNN